MTNIIELKNITYSYNKKNNILENISLNIKKGKITTIIGQNGSGKSTLFNILSNNLKNYFGDVVIDNRNLKNYTRKELAKKIAVVYQNNKTLEELTVLEAVSYGRMPYQNLLFNKQSEEDVEKINFALNAMNLYSLKNELVSNLSGGQLQRVYIAIALAQDTKIIILDEPTVYLDIKYQKMIMELLKNINKKYGITILMILHDINQALKYSDDIFIISNKKIINDGNKNNILCSDILDKVFDVPIEKTNDDILITW